MPPESEGPGPENPDVYEFPASPAQSRLLMLERLSPATAQYNVPVAFRVSGPFDHAAFAAALDLVVARHESLRTTFRTVGDQEIQAVAAFAKAEVRVLDVSCEAEADDAVTAEARRPFDLEHGPLLRSVVYRLPDGSHRVLLAMHHLICDGWSLRILLEELAIGYRAALTGRPAGLPALAIQYPDYSAWQERRLADGEFAEAVEHWRRSLDGAPLTPILPTDRPRPAVQTSAAESERVVLPPDLHERLARTARSAGATQYTVMLAAFAVLLSRLSGRTDVVVGTPAAGRDHPDLQRVVGFLTTTLALRIDLSGPPTFAELLLRVRDRLSGAHQYQDAPFESVVEAVAGQRDPSHDPVVQVVFTYDDTEYPLDLHGAQTERLPLTLRAAKADLVMYTERWAADTVIQFDYRSDLFDPATVRHWLRNFLVLLDHLLDRPELPVDSAALLDDAQRRQMLRSWNSAAQTVPSGLVTDLIAEQAATRPDAVALVCDGTTLTYAELLARADRLADGLRAAGVGPEVPVGVCLGRTAEMVIAALAVLRAGGVYLALEVTLPQARLMHVLEDTGIRLILTGPQTAGRLPDLGVEVAEVADAATDFVNRPTSGSANPSAQRPTTPANAAYIIYTSGSTGVPKGVLVGHRSLMNATVAARDWQRLTPESRVLQQASYAFDISVLDVFATWIAGAALHIATDDERIGEALYARLREDRITHLFITPTAVMSLPCPPDALEDLTELAVGGEPSPDELVRRWTTARRRVVNAYGPAEAAVVSTTGLLVPDAPVVIGRPVPNYRVYILDSHLQPAPVGVAGEIYLSGEGLARGYVNRPGPTAERFVADPFGPPGTRMYRSGDLARYDAAGRIHYLGRTDGQVKLRGFRIELGEIETVLAGHPKVAAAAATVRGGATDPHLVGYLVPADPADPPQTAELRARLADRLPGYMVPDVFVQLAELPTNNSGKVDRSRLPDPPTARPDTGRRYVQPSTPAEVRVARIWAQVLGIDEIGRHDNFFDIGGNSLRLLAVHAALREEAGPGGEAIALVDLFRFPDVATLAARLDQAAAPPPAAAARRHGDERRRRLADRTAAARNGNPTAGTSKKGDIR
ncbi:MAG TPA: amino acid adenylation domain-containing protein [Actinocrinis sp.]|nr:amino acid adenylation domain-containing protein [Actinocrinis sp.]